MRIGLDHHPCAEAAAELDLAARFVAEDVLDERGHAAEGAAAEARLVEAFDAIGIGLDDRVHLRIYGGDGARGSLSDFSRGNLPRFDQCGDAQGVVAGVFGELHAGTR